MFTGFKAVVVKPRQLLSLNAYDRPIEPTTFPQASQLPVWGDAMHDEFHALVHNKTWIFLLKMLLGAYGNIASNTSLMV